MKIIMSFALFEALQSARQEFIANIDATAEFKPFVEEREALFACTRDCAHVGVCEGAYGSIEITVNDKLVNVLIAALNLYGQTVYQVVCVMERVMPTFAALYEKARHLFYQRL